MKFDSLQNYAYEFYEQLTPYAKIASVGGIIIAFYIPFRYFTARQRKTPIKNDYKQGLVYLYQFPRMKYVPTMSAFCLKMETWLRMADIQYENICSWTVRSLEGTLPFLEYNGKEYPDSALAIRDMTAIFSKETMENHLNNEQKATARAFEAMAENSLGMANTYFRLVEHIDDAIQYLPDNAFGILTPLWKFLFMKMMAFKIKKRMPLFPIGKHSRDEIVNIANDDLKAISSYLGNKHYFTGFKPTRGDIGQIGINA
ncbi:unnamed protein product [Onchocerca ochengi]|uniref:Thioredoxin-like_fold domain-containing protein n=2 Tax=Onchocerca TaxID=6281 RepID=A0A182EJG3_ONCOC|nr:unnamed protein product [Onchocerca ochengi]